MKTDACHNKKEFKKILMRFHSTMQWMEVRSQNFSQNVTAHIYVNLSNNYCKNYVFNDKASHSQLKV